MALTPRQTEIKDLQSQGMKAKQIAESLGITENAVYQQLRRMRDGGGSKSAASNGRKSAPKAAPLGDAAAETKPTKRPTRVPGTNTIKPMTPEQALTAERKDIVLALDESAKTVAAAEKALTEAVEAHKALSTQRAQRVQQIDAALTALTGETPDPIASLTAVGTVSDEQADAEVTGDSPALTQAEREASADFDGTDDTSAQEEAETGEPVAA